jgi:two-component system sensor histidine kinase DesK
MRGDDPVLYRRAVRCERVETVKETDPTHSGVYFPTPAPPSELRGLILAVVGLSGLSALALLFVEELGDPGTIGALASILVSLAVCVWLVRNGLDSLSRSSMLVVLAIATAALISAFALSRNPVSILGTSAPFGLGVAWIRPRWVPAVVGLGAVALAIVAALLVHGHVEGRSVAQAGIVFGAGLIGFAGTSISWQMQRRADQHHADRTELSLARERLRFATDLHDIQGHTLLAIKMKAELARRSLDRDPDRVAQELNDIEALAAEAGEQTRELAQGYRTLTLAAELATLDQLLTAAGIRVRIDNRGAPAVQHEELFAALVRESASNVLRHAAAERVDITLAPTTVTVTNDGAEAAQTGRTGSGLAGLEGRFQRAGGTVDWHRDSTDFTVTGSIGGSA